MIIYRTFYRRLVAAGVAAGAVAVAPAPFALAHDVVIGGNPGDGEVVEEFPRSIELEFSGLPQGSFTTVAVSNQDSGEILFSGEPSIDDRVVTLDLPTEVTGGPGDYTVGFQITSSDGHATRNTTTFTVAGETTPPAETEAIDEAAEQTETAGDTSTGLGRPVVLFLIGLGIFAVITGVIVLILRGRNRF